jgi:hypothetical protein
MNTERCGNNSEQKCHAKGSRIETKIKEFMYRDTTNNWGHRNSKED